MVITVYNIKQVDFGPNIALFLEVLCKNIKNDDTIFF
jgi:hypothetical protein